MKSNFEAFILMMLIFLGSPMHLFPQDIVVKYLANEGVWIQSDHVQIMIDPLFSEDFDTYFTLPEEEKQKIRNGQPPYHEINYLIISHHHADHFEPTLVKDFLLKNEQVTLLAPLQVLAALEELEDQAIPPERIEVIDAHRNKTPVEVSFDDVEFAFTWIQHAGARNASVQNLVSMITIHEKAIMHFGDAMGEAELYSGWVPPFEGVALALVPVWFLIDGEARELLKNKIEPGIIAAVHVPRIFNHWVPEIKEDFPGAILFTTFGKEVILASN